MPVARYEDLEIWKTAFKLAREVYRISQNGDFSKDFGMRDQVRRASLSTMANIAEGFARMSDREFIRFLDIARSSAMEVQSLLHLALSLGYLSRAEFDGLYDLCDHIRAGSTSLIRHLRAKVN